MNNSSDFFTQIYIDKNFESLRLFESLKSFRLLALSLILLIVVIVLGLIFIPWQQSVTGIGKVMIFTPMDRPQNIEAQIPGRIIKWNVTEGQSVKANDIIAELSDIDSKFLDLGQPERLNAQKLALIARKEAALTRARALEDQMDFLSKSREVAIPSATERTNQAKDRLLAAEQALKASQQNLKTAQLNLKRIKELNEKGLRSNRDSELVELDYVKAETDVERAQSALEIAKRDTIIGGLDQSKVVNDTAASINNIKASLFAANETVASVENDLIKLEIDIQNLSSRVDQRIVKSPCNGKIVRVLKVGASETVKASDVLAVIAPQTTDQSVEVFLSDNDAPLVSIGRQVRLQFAGWPAIQFTGWPSVAVGTFGGKISVIDPIDDGKNRYRIIITPDFEAINSHKDEPWPSSNYLRPGTEVTGWIMLDTVSLGFELWRQFNAFPPTVQREPLGNKDVKQEKDAKNEK